MMLRKISIRTCYFASNVKNNSQKCNIGPLHNVQVFQRLFPMCLNSAGDGFIIHLNISADKESLL
jgi:hypothetical protein